MQNLGVAPDQVQGVEAHQTLPKIKEEKKSDSDDDMDYGDEWAEKGNTTVIVPSVGIGKWSILNLNISLKNFSQLLKLL